jgi:hypothetical protein
MKLGPWRNMVTRRVARRVEEELVKKTTSMQRLVP